MKGGPATNLPTEKLADGVYAYPESIVREGREYTYHLTVVETPRGVVLVDAGHEKAVDELEANLAATGHDWEDVTAVLLTHQDNDHVSALHGILERTGAVFADGDEFVVSAPYDEDDAADSVDRLVEAGADRMAELAASLR